MTCKAIKICPYLNIIFLFIPNIKVRFICHGRWTVVCNTDKNHTKKQWKKGGCRGEKLFVNCRVKKGGLVCQVGGQNYLFLIASFRAHYNSFKLCSSTQDLNNKSIINKNNYGQISSGHMIQYGDSQDIASIFILSYLT